MAPHAREPGRRLDIALGLVHRLAVLFLDEPATGLDPQSRVNLWGEVRRLAAEGITVLLTTHYLEEADALAGGNGIPHRARRAPRLRPVRTSGIPKAKQDPA